MTVLPRILELLGVEVRATVVAQSGGPFANRIGLLPLRIAKTARQLDSGGEGIRWSIFEKNSDDAFISALALAVKKHFAVLDLDAPQNDELTTGFEEYAAGGFAYLEQSFREMPGDVWRTFWRSFIPWLSVDRLTMRAGEENARSLPLRRCGAISRRGKKKFPDRRATYNI